MNLNFIISRHVLIKSFDIIHEIKVLTSLLYHNYGNSHTSAHPHAHVISGLIGLHSAYAMYYHAE